MTPTAPATDQPIAVWIHASELEPWSANYNEHPREQLDELHASVDTFWTDPILVHARDGGRRVISGGGRRIVALEKIERSGGTWKLPDAPAPGVVPCRLFHGTAEEADELAVAANEIPRHAQRDDLRLGRVLESIAARRQGIDHATTLRLGLRRGEIAELIHRARPRPPAAEAQEPPEIKPPKRPVSKVGQVYELGPHRVRCGESLDVDGLRHLLQEEPADLIFSDPPYAIYGSSTGIGRDIADDGMIRPFFSEILHHASASLRLFGLCWICCDWRSWPSWFDVAKGTDLAVKNALVWDKRGAGLGNQYAQTYEMVGYFVKSPVERAFMSTRKTGIRGVHAPNVWHVAGEPLAEGEPLPREHDADPGLVYGDPNVSSAEGVVSGVAIQHNRVSGVERVHNAQKPVDLVAAIMRPAARPGEVLLDLFAGSGSMLFAGEKLGLRVRLSERSPQWVDVIRKRWGTYARDLGIEPGPGAL